MSVRVGIIGPGGIAERHAAALTGAGATLAAVAGPDLAQAAAFAAAHPTQGYGRATVHRTADELCAQPGLDAVIVAAPHAVHAEQAIAALEAGLHVLCEIPAGLSLAEARAVADAAERAGRHAAVAHTLRFCSPYLAAKELIEAGESRVRHVVARTLMLRQRDTGLDGRARDWSDDVLWHHGAHAVDAALWLLGAASAEVSGGLGPPWKDGGRAMDVGAVLRVQDGGLVTIALSYHSRLAARDLTIIAEDRTLHLSGGRLLDGDRLLADCGDADRMEREGLARQDRDFLAAVTEGRPPACTVADVLPAMRVLDHLHRLNEGNL